MREPLARLFPLLTNRLSPVAVVIAGIGLAFAAGLVPHRAHAFQLLPLQVAAGVLPYVIFGMLAWMLREPELRRYGFAVLALHLTVVVIQRGLGGGDWLLVATPLLLTAALLTLWPRALRASAPRSGARDRH